jgi:hypothetical protein
MSKVHPLYGALITTLARAGQPRRPVNPLPLMLRCAIKLDEAARLTEQGYPEESAQFTWLARLVRSHVARAEEDTK